MLSGPLPIMASWPTTWMLDALPSLELVRAEIVINAAESHDRLAAGPLGRWAAGPLGRWAGAGGRRRACEPTRACAGPPGRAETVITALHQGSRPHRPPRTGAPSQASGAA